MTAVVVVLTVVVGLLAVMVVGLLRSHAEILRALHDLGINLDHGADHDGARTFDVRRSEPSGPPTFGPAPFSPAPSGSVPFDEIPFETASDIAAPDRRPLPAAMDLRGTTPDGDAVQVGIIGAEVPTLLAFLSSGCGTCLEFWDGLAGSPRGIEGAAARLVAVTKGPDAESPSAVAELAPEHHVTIMSTEAFEDYGVSIAPYFVLVDGRRGVIGEGAARTWDQLVTLLRRAGADGDLASSSRPSRRQLLAGRTRPRVDEVLASAGIDPGHHSLYDDPRPES